jgi:putative chitinase
MVISIANLIAAGIAPTQARLFAEPLTEACARFQINTPARLAPFIANANHESLGFTRLEENLFYSRPERIREVWKVRFPSVADAIPYARNPKALANRVYALRMGNGDEASGDGFRFRGRGLFQLTGRAGYRRAGNALGRPYEIAPDMVALPAEAALTAAWYWFDSRCNQLADAGLIDEITRAINGPAMMAANERRDLTEEALRAFA